jgi:hypothetical protein
MKQAVGLGETLRAGVCVAVLSISLWGFSCASSGPLLQNQISTQARADAREAGHAAPSPVPIKTSEPSGPNSTKAPATKAALFISGDPSGARIFVDGAFVGFAPVELERKQGFYEISAFEEGYEPWTAGLSYDGKSALTVVYSLRRETGFIDLELEPSDARAWIEGGQELGKGLNRVPTGTFTLRAALFGYESFSTEVEVLKDRTSQAAARLEPRRMGIEAKLSSSAFNPDEAGNVSRLSLRAVPDSYGYVRVRVSDSAGTELFAKEFPFVDSDAALDAEWNGRDAAGGRLPLGEYRALFEYWDSRTPRADGNFPREDPDGRIERAVRISGDFLPYAGLSSGVSGLDYCPDADVIAEAVQVSVTTQGTYASADLWLGRASLQGRTSIPGSKGVEGDSVVGFSIYPGQGLRFALGLASKQALFSLKSGGASFLGALYERFSFFSEGIVVDPFADMRGASVGLPLQVGCGPWSLTLCPELLLSPYTVNDPASAAADIWSHAWRSIPYARAGLRGRFGTGYVGASAAYRFKPLGPGGLQGDPPLGISLEAGIADQDRGIRYGFSALGQFAGPQDFYILMGLSAGAIFRGPDY